MARVAVCRLLAFVTAALAALAPGSAGAQVQVVSGHPRIFLRPADLATLRDRARNRPAIAAFYQQMKSRMDGSSSRHSNDEVAGFELESLALLHVVESPSTAYRDKAVGGWVRTGYGAGSIDHWSLPFVVMGQALALDWMWDSLSDSQRTAIGQGLVAMMDDLKSYAPWDTSGANQMSDYSNQLYFHLGSLAFAGAALADSGIADDTARAYLDEARTLIDAHMLPATNQEAGGDAELAATSGFAGNGGWGEDMGHMGMTHPMFGRMLEAWRTATGEDFFPRANGLTGITRYAVTLRRPGGNLSPKGNNSYEAGLSDKEMGTLGSLTSARYGDALGKHLKDVTWAGGSYGFHQLGAVLWYDDALADVDLGQLPRAIHFQGQGEVVVRSGFGASDAWVYLRSGPIYNGHQHDDQGNLLIEAFGGELLVENAGNDATDPAFGVSSSHNTLSVGGDQIVYWNNEVQFARPVAGTPQDRGRITAFEDAGDYQYAAADFGTAYPDAQVSAPKAGKVTREIVTILPGVVAVRDRVAASGSVEVLWHVWSASQLNVDAAQRRFDVTDGSGHAAAAVVLPAAVGIDSSATQGSTRVVSVTASSPQNPQRFLHLFFLSPAASPFFPSDLTPIDGSAAEGASFTDSAGGRWEIRFRKDGQGLVGVTRDGNPVTPPDGGSGTPDSGRSDAGPDSGPGASDGGRPDDSGTAGANDGGPGSQALEAGTGRCGCGQGGGAGLAVVAAALLGFWRRAD